MGQAGSPAGSSATARGPSARSGRPRLGRPAASRYRLRRPPFRRPGAGRPGHRPGRPDPGPAHPRRGRPTGRGRRPGGAAGRRVPQRGAGPRIQEVRNISWYRGCKAEPVVAILIPDPLGRWRDEALVATDPTASAEFLIPGYRRRRSVGPAFFDSRQHLGSHDPRVRVERSVERAHPRAWFVGAPTILGDCLVGHQGSHVHRDRPRYCDRPTPTFTDMSGAPRLQMGESGVFGEPGDEGPSPDCIRELLNTLSAVGEKSGSLVRGVGRSPVGALGNGPSCPGRRGICTGSPSARPERIAGPARSASLTRPSPAVATAHRSSASPEEPGSPRWLRPIFLTIMGLDPSMCVSPLHVADGIALTGAPDDRSSARSDEVRPGGRR